MKQPPSALPDNFVLQWLAGASYIGRAVGFMVRHRLWRVAALPIVINFLLVLALAFLGWYQVWPWLAELDAGLQAMAGDGEVIRSALSIMTWVVWIALLPVLIVLAAVVVFLFGHVAASPFLDILSERVECIVTGRVAGKATTRRAFDSFFTALGDALWGVLYLAFVYTPLLLMSFIPGVGALVSLTCGALIMSQELVGLPLCRQLVSYRARWRFILRNKWFCLGFGAVAAALWAVPLLNIVSLPVAVTGGTLLYCDLLRDGRLDGSART